MKSLIGTKIGMTQLIGDDGVVSAVTLIKAGPITVTQLKTNDKDGYSAVQVGYDETKKLSKSLTGHVKKSKSSPRVIREVRTAELPEDMKVGDTIDTSVFAIGDIVNVTGTSKGKGFAGTVKMHNFRTSKKSHGGNGSVRKPGSIGSMYPQKVFKGKRMARQMGAERVTVKNLQVAFIDARDNVIGLKGAVPGPRKGLVVIGGKI
ncbi:MAG: 50S ribosomal protein L3 [Segetibacter sp.]